MTSAPTLRLASYNIQKCVGLDFRRQPQRIMQVLDGLQADIVVLQEADKRLPPRPAALPHFMLDEAGWQIVDLGGAGSLGWHGNAVIWRGEGISLRETGHIKLPGLEPRGAVRVDFETPIGPLRVMGMHLGLISHFRQQQVLHLVREMEDLPALPTVWAGDFNEWSPTMGFDPLEDAFDVLSPGRSFHSRRPMAQLDRFASGERIAVTDAGVHETGAARIASDHLPVWADVELTPSEE